MKQLKRKYSRIVVKLGSSIFSLSSGKINYSYLSAILDDILDLISQGKEIVIVSSGAIAFGMNVLKLKTRPKKLSVLQTAASIGQVHLMDAFNKFLKPRGIACSQILLTWDDFSQKKRFINARNTLLDSLRLKVIPVVNENDAVSVEEIKFGDNDKLSSLVSGLVDADLLIILSDVDGLYKGKKCLRIVKKITPDIERFACGTDKEHCVGGMSSKITAAKIAGASGIPLVIANGKTKNVLSKIINHYAVGTIFIPKNTRVTIDSELLTQIKAKHF
ncbi:MAG: glutamate 5-kinase [Candidatus Omnitrophota bacterium]